MKTLVASVRTQFDEHINSLSKATGELKTVVEAVSATAGELEGFACSTE